MSIYHSFFFSSFSFFQSSLETNFKSSSLLIYLSDSKPSLSLSPLPPQIIAVDFGWTTTVPLNYATNSPFFSESTWYGIKSSCSKHSFTPTFAPVRSSKPLIENGRVGYFLFTIEKKFLALLLFKLYWTSISLLYTVVLKSA